MASRTDLKRQPPGRDEAAEAEDANARAGAAVLNHLTGDGSRHSCGGSRRSPMGSDSPNIWLCSSRSNSRV